MLTKVSVLGRLLFRKKDHKFSLTQQQFRAEWS